MRSILTCLLAMIGLTSACGHQEYDETDVEGFAKLLRQPDVVLLDVRTAEEYAAGHIEGALHIDQGQGSFLKVVQAEVSTEQTIAVYCRSGRRSARAAAILAAAGYKVTNLRGGILAWTHAGKPVSTQVRRDEVPADGLSAD